jgi:hypothetical protein
MEQEQKYRLRASEVAKYKMIRAMCGGASNVIREIGLPGFTRNAKVKGSTEHAMASRYGVYSANVPNIIMSYSWGLRTSSEVYLTGKSGVLDELKEIFGIIREYRSSSRPDKSKTMTEKEISMAISHARAAVVRHPSFKDIGNAPNVLCVKSGSAIPYGMKDDTIHISPNWKRTVQKSSLELFSDRIQDKDNPGFSTTRSFFTCSARRINPIFAMGEGMSLFNACVIYSDGEYVRGPKGRSRLRVKTAQGYIARWIGTDKTFTAFRKTPTLAVDAVREMIEEDVYAKL